MKIDDTLETLSRFFNDLIGGVIPGIILIFGLIIMHVGPRDEIINITSNADGGFVAIFVSLAYAAGHALLAIHSNLVQPIFQRLNILRPDSVADLENKKSYLLFKMMIGNKINDLPLDTTNPAISSSWRFHDLRSIALSISSEASSLGRRFMFISLLCNGVGTALVIMLLDFVSCSLFSPQFLFVYNHALPASLQASLLMVVAYSVYKQGNVFYTRALSTPFPVAVSQLLIK